MPPAAAFRGRVPEAGRLLAQIPPQLLRSWYIMYFQLPWLPERSASWVLPRLWRRWSPGYEAKDDLRHVDAAIGTPESWRAALEAGSIVDDLRGRFHQQRLLLLEERLKEMPDVSPEERHRIARITEELIERVLDEPAERLRSGRGMRGRLGAVEALRHIFGLDDGKQ